MNTSKWKPIPDFEGLYEYDQFGNVMVLSRSVKNGASGFRFIKPSIKKYTLNGKYYQIHLIKNKKPKTFRRNRLVWQYHNGPIPVDYEIHHKDENTLNDDILNLKICFWREHRGEHKTSKLKSSFIGVHGKDNGTWRAVISQNGNQIHLGIFDSEILASIAYKKALQEINNGMDLFLLYPKKDLSAKGTTYFCNTRSRWVSRFRGKHIGIFNSQKEAIIALDNYKKNISNN